MKEFIDTKIYLISLQDAIDAKSFLFEKPFILKKGDYDEGLKNSDHVIHGDMKVGGQEHFYLETHASCVIPLEDDQYDAFVGTQAPYSVQVRETGPKL